MEGVSNYYGKLNDIIELNYSGLIRVVLFKCDGLTSIGVARKKMV